MTGRGFLKNRMVKTTTAESDESSCTAAPPKKEDAHIQKVPIPVISTEALIAGQQQAVRGRRVITLIFLLE